MSAQTEAYQKWLRDEDVIRMHDATTLHAPESSNQYLSNRLYHAYHDGFRAGEQYEKERILKKIGELIA